MGHAGQQRLLGHWDLEGQVGDLLSLVLNLFRKYQPIMPLALLLL